LKKTDEISKLQLELFDIMFWSVLTGWRMTSHLSVRIKNRLVQIFYPADMAKEEFENWIKQHPQDEKLFTSELTVIRRQNGKLVAIPYSEYYKEPLTKFQICLRKLLSMLIIHLLKNICFLVQQHF
jgi:hypothetical protein